MAHLVDVGVFPWPTLTSSSHRRAMNKLGKDGELKKQAGDVAGSHSYVHTYYNMSMFIDYPGCIDAIPYVYTYIPYINTHRRWESHGHPFCNDVSFIIYICENLFTSGI